MPDPRRESKDIRIFDAKKPHDEWLQAICCDHSTATRALLDTVD